MRSWKWLAVTACGMTVLFIAATGESADMVKLLLKNGADPKGINWPRNTLLHTAAESTENEVLTPLHVQ